MKRIVRKGAFESNSSSSHSLVVTKATTTETPDVWLTKDGMIDIWDETDLEFCGSPQAPLVEFRDKLRYLIAAYSQDKEKINEIVETVKRIIPDCNGIKFPRRNNLWPYDIEVDSYGYIDHQSSHILRNYLEKHNVSFEEFLTRNKYIIVLDGDEYNMWESFKAAGLINEDFIVKEIGIYDKEYY